MVRPSLYNSYVGTSSISILSMSKTIPLLCLMFSTASLIIERVFKPKKSILINPVSSMTEPSYWVTNIFSPVSLSSAVLTGTQSVISSRQIIVPQACTPVLRTLPSNILAYRMVSRNIGLDEASASCSSGTSSMAFGKFIFLPLGNRSGIALHKRSDSDKGNFCTRATSFMANLVAIVP